MRIGKKSSIRSWTKAGSLGKPKHVSSESIVGLLSPDLISTVWHPLMAERALEILENYAHDCYLYDERMNNVAEAEVAMDGSTKDGDLPLPPPQPVFHSPFMIEEQDVVIKETSDYFFSKGGGWKKQVNAAKFERLLDERYGILRPFITSNPKVERFVKNVQRKHVAGYFSPFRQGNPPMSKASAIMLLFFLKRGNIHWQALMLTALFLLVGLQPWALVTIIGAVHFVFASRKARPVGKMMHNIPLVEPYYETGSESMSESETNEKKQSSLKLPVGKPLGSEEKIDAKDYDTILLGSGPSCLYTASLLTRAGRKVLILSERSDASGCLTLNDCKDRQLNDIPFDVEANTYTKLSKIQKFLVPALCTTTDYQGGIRFAQVGSDADGYAFEILAIPGLGTDSPNAHIPFILRAEGIQALMNDSANYLGDGWPDEEGGIGQSATGAFVAACNAINNSAGQFYLSKILDDSVNKFRGTDSYQESGIRYAAGFLNNSFPLNAHARSLMAGIGMKGENIKPGQTSMAAHVTNVSAAMSGEGKHYPLGGPRALCHALANVVERSGGRVVTGVNVNELVFVDESAESARQTNKENGDEPAPPRCIGVKLSDDRKILFDPSVSDTAIVSMKGFIHTFVMLLPDEVRTKHKVPRGLPALSARRHVFKFLFALNGSADDLSVTGADYYRLPAAAVARDKVDPITGGITYGETGGLERRDREDKEEVSSSSKVGVTVDIVNKDPSTEDENKKNESIHTKRRPFKFESGVSWIHIAFPSAKDPSFESRYGKLTTCVVTIEADDDFVQQFETKPELFVVKKPTSTSQDCIKRLGERVKKDLFDIYPQLEGKIAHAEARGPFESGLSQSPERFAAKGVKALTPYPGLFIGGSDLTIGDSCSSSIVGGWLAANAVAGYKAADYLFLKKNITSDLEQFLEHPTLPEDEDVAVPYKPEDADAAA